MSVQSLEKRYDSDIIFSNLSFTLDEGHKVALVGKNGAGKSTLLKLLAGIEDPSAGTVSLTGDRIATYLPQEVAIDEARTGVAYLQDGTDLQPHQFFPVLDGLGLSHSVAEQSLSSMSGGQQTKIFLAKFLLEPADIFLLDEPTNNLDIPSLLWLEAFLVASKKTMIIISHDIVFLNAVANRVFELKNGELAIERGTYSDYIERKEKEFSRQMKEYNQYVEQVRELEGAKTDLQQKGERIDATEASDRDKMLAGARRDRASAGQQRVRSIERRIKKLGVVEKPFEEDPFSLELEARQIEGEIGIEVDKMVAGYPDGVSVGPMSFSLKLGDRMCFLGMNGAGKSTVLKSIVGMLPPLDGSVVVAENVLFGDLMQQHERADRSETVIDFFIRETHSNAERAIHMLKRAGFTESLLKQKIAGLSAGMRARLLFSVFVVLGVNVLILDEPTNHLDIEAIAALKEMLKTYAGVVLLVSHNRWFLEEMHVGTYYAISDGKVERVQDFEKYVSAGKKRAEQMLRRLQRVLS